MSNKFRQDEFSGSDLRKVADAPPPDAVPLQVGDWCKLNSGSPDLLVLDADAENVTVGIAGGKETTIPRACVRRVS